MSHKKTTQQKRIEGTLRKDRLNPNEPTPAPGIPKAPAHLSARARAAWKVLSERLDAIGVLTQADGLALEGLCEAYADLQQARESLAAHGGRVTYECTTKSGDVMYRSHPEVAMIADADRRVQTWLAKFGLTPADRSRVSAREPKDPHDELWAVLASPRNDRAKDVQ
jgi:P27 family predicted phage terminase small subunit